MSNLKNIKEVCAVLLLVVMSGCYVEPEPPTTPQEWCEVLVTGVQDMRDRCGYVDAAPYWRYVDCQEVERIRNVEVLESLCLPALATECAEYDTPQEWGCHQLSFQARN